MRFRDVLFGILLGLGAGMLLAPQNGRQNRAFIRDKAVRYSHDTADFMDRKSRHLANKAKGYAHDISGKVSSVVSKGKEAVEEESSASV